MRGAESASVEDVEDMERESIDTSGIIIGLRKVVNEPRAAVERAHLSAVTEPILAARPSIRELRREDRDRNSLVLEILVYTWCRSSY